MIIGIVSDIHEDITRLKEALVLFEKRNVTELVCLGDLVGFSVPYYTYFDTRNSNEVVQIIREQCTHCVIGNHDLYAIQRIPDQRSHFNYPEHWYELDFEERKRLASGEVFLYEDNELPSLLSSKNKEYLLSLPEHVVMDAGDHNILLSHYAYPDCTGSSTCEVTEPPQLQQHWDFMLSQQCLYSFSGNDHFEGVRLFTATRRIDYSFEAIQLPNDALWLHGPTISQGTFNNGCMIYDTQSRTLEAIPLHSTTHTVLRR
ncbi:metallophosphoesterase family protein [Paenibacillus massiliensis]|uniref:metallophosphoesterase family protein n=1 Tax=Paenibacillus massiliensis TaxID=225917 RepID=UPI0004290C10|nr:metallophosphoesterase family protein [Paenibacillus massiliensis]